VKKIVLLFVVVIASLVSGTTIRSINATTKSPVASSPAHNAKVSESVEAPNPARILTFEKRVSYQRAIEEVYWRHRIWPKENPDSKPSLDVVMSQAELENKVAGYLRDSLVLQDYWHRTITAEQLQGEMDRMARETKQPEVLQQLFEALGNDPAVIAECLARPVLAERLLVDSASEHVKRKRRTHAQVVPGPGNYSLPSISTGNGCTDDTWTPTSTTNAPSARVRHTAVWTGSEMIIWGGSDNTGSKYNPSTDSWTATTLTNAPSPRGFHTAVWTGTEMIVWGGFDEPNNFNSGGRYNPATDSWIATSTTNAPAPRYYHTAIWTGNQMIVWGGSNGTNYFNSGGKYNPVTDSWIATATDNAPSARVFHTAVWTGSQMIVWGGDAPAIANSGGRYDPSTDIWIATSTTNAPTARAVHSAVWTGFEMIVWGGTDGTITFGDGAKYNPSTDSWTATRLTNEPSGVEGHTAVWTGNEMIVWGGDGPCSELLCVTNGGARYNPTTDSWVYTSITNAPVARAFHTAVWTGNEMIVWGGADFSGFFNTGGQYCAQTPALLSQFGNISTRAFVQTGDNVMIGGFIVRGSQLKRVIIRAIGPELNQYGVPNPLSNPTLELHDITGALIASNDNWQHTIIGGIITGDQRADIRASGHAPQDGRESAIVADLPPGNYTAIVRGVNDTTGVALAEVYDLSPEANSTLGNVSTRSFVQTGDNVMIGGFIVQGTQSKRLILRAIGPELGAPPYNIPNALANPTLELHNGTGALIASNDDWRHTILGGIITSDQRRDILGSGYAPGDLRESAIIATLQPGNYTAIVRGVTDTTGVALVEAYDLD